MPIAQNDTTPVSTPSVKIAKQYLKPDIDSSKFITVDDTVSAMKKYVDGYNWTVTYYSNIAASDDRLTTLDDNTVSASQQYNRVNGLNLKLTTPLSNTSYENLNGVALVDIVLTPRVGDYIKGTILDGSEGIFSVIKVNEVSYNASKLYEIEFKFDTNIELDPLRVADLDNKSVRDYYAVDSDNGTTVLDPGTYVWRSKVVDYIKGLPKLYNRFYKNGYAVLVKDGATIYDPYITSLFNTVTGGYNVQHRDSGVNVYDTQLAILLGDNSPILFKLNKATVTEVNHNTLATDSLGRLPYDITHIIKVGSDGDWLYPTTGNSTVLPSSTSMDSTGKYLYDPASRGTSIELLLHQIQHKEALSRSHLIKLLNDIESWTSEQRYYYVPIVIGICLYELRNLRVKGVANV